MSNIINGFNGEYRFLSNFANIPIVYDLIPCKSAESAFQMMKTTNLTLRYKIADSNPSKAKAIGRSVRLREDWEQIKDKVMYEIVHAKFIQNPDILRKLINTGDAILIEGNTWGDKYWGQVKDKSGKWVGENKLGLILMKVREELKEENKKNIKTYDI